MKRKIVIVAMALSLAYAFWQKGEKQEVSVITDEVHTVNGSVKIQASAAPAEAGTRFEEADGGQGAKSPEGEALPVIAPRLFFPKAKVVSKEESPVDANGRTHVIKTLEERERLIRVEETYEASTLVDQIAMVANQVLAAKPDSLADDQFLGILERAGAQDVRRAGESYLVTFRAEPLNPHALEDFMAKLKTAFNGEAIVEPNYIRRLL